MILDEFDALLSEAQRKRSVYVPEGTEGESTIAQRRRRLAVLRVAAVLLG